MRKNNMRIFLSTPISCFRDPCELQAYKNSVKNLIVELKKNHSVCSEIEKIEKQSDYDTPEKSISTDLESIKKCDVFVLHYPKSIPTSALIELGFAIAFNKRIIIITPQIAMLPYLSLGTSSVCSESLIIESESLDLQTINKIMSCI